MRETFPIPKAEKPKRPLTKVELLLSNLKEQYQEQIKAQLETGVLELLSDGRHIGYVDYKGEERAVPKYEEIVEAMERNYELVERKFEQGFTQFQLTPQLAALSFLTDRVHDEILKAKKEGRLKATDGSELKLDEDHPLYVADEYQDADTSGELIYFPTAYDPENHGGKTKEELRDDPRLLNGFLLSLTEDLPDLPAEGKGETVGERRQIEAGKSPDEYLKLLQTDPQYAQEAGLTPEQWLIYFLHNLKKGRVADDYVGRGKVNWNLGGFLKGSGLVSLANWDRNFPRACLNGNHHAFRNGNYGVRSAVNIFDI